jgi:hypothetical protein
MDAATLTAAIAQAKTQLAALDAAINARLDPTTRSYSLDTSQSIQRWEGHSISEMMDVQGRLLNRICTLQARQSGSGAIIAVPAW